MGAQGVAGLRGRAGGFFLRRRTHLSHYASKYFCTHYLLSYYSTYFMVMMLLR